MVYYFFIRLESRYNMEFSTGKQKVIIVSSLVLFLLLAIFREQLIHMDEAIYSWLTAYELPGIFSIMEGLTEIGSGEMILIITFIIAAILAFKRLWGYAFFSLVVTFGGIFINLALKMTIQRGRPGESRDLEVFGHSLDLTSYSFPSGHAMRIVLLALILIFLAVHFIKSKKLKTITVVLCIALPLLVCVSRVIIGMHYFTDVLAAAFVAIFWFQVCYLFFTERFSSKTRVHQRY